VSVKSWVTCAFEREPNVELPQSPVTGAPPSLLVQEPPPELELEFEAPPELVDPPVELTPPLESPLLLELDVPEPLLEPVEEPPPPSPPAVEFELLHAAREAATATAERVSFGKAGLLVPRGLLLNEFDLARYSKSGSQFIVGRLGSI
jgi:hypothetical protein